MKGAHFHVVKCVEKIPKCIWRVSIRLYPCFSAYVEGKFYDTHWVSQKYSLKICQHFVQGNAL